METFDETAFEEEGFRVVLTNRGKDPKSPPLRLRYPNHEKETVECGMEGCSETTYSFTGLCADHRKTKNKYADHTADWVSQLIPPGYTREDVEGMIETHRDIAYLLWDWAKGEPNRLEVLDAFILEDAARKIPGKIPDATSLQDCLGESDKKDHPCPPDFLEWTRTSVNEHFPESEYQKVYLPGDKKEVDDETVEWDQLPIRVAAALYYLALICEEANRGDEWYKEYHGVDKRSVMAGAFMPVGFYLFLRYTGASKEKVNTILR